MGHLTEGELAGYLDEDLSADERRQVEEHLDACDDCRTEVIEAARLLAEEWEHEAPVSPDIAEGGRRASGPRWAIPAGIAGIAAAAVLATVLLIEPGTMPSGDDQPSDRERFVTEGVERLAVYAPPEDGAVAREGLRFTWADAGTDSYRITITAEDGRLVWAHSSADTTVIPPSTLELETGERFFWYVDAISAGVVGRTGAHSFVVTD